MCTHEQRDTAHRRAECEEHTVAVTPRQPISLTSAALSPRSFVRDAPHVGTCGCCTSSKASRES
eukprot:3263835-Pleurochrysis_carterae.AAC.3